MRTPPILSKPMQEGPQIVRNNIARRSTTIRHDGQSKHSIQHVYLEGRMGVVDGLPETQIARTAECRLEQKLGYGRHTDLTIKGS